MPAYARKINSNAKKGAAMGGAIGLVGGPAGVLIGAFIGGILGKFMTEDSGDIENRKDDGILNIVIWDVQHGSATYIKTPNGRHIIQDLGIGSCYGSCYNNFSPIRHMRDIYKVDRLDYAIITHLHKDHIGDILNLDQLPNILNRPDVCRDDIMEKITNEDEELFEKYFDIEEKYSEIVDPNIDPLLPKNNGGANIDIFTPEPTSSNINNHSSVTIISYAGSKVILPGDNESISWKELLELPNFRNSIKNADILLAPHHGRLSQKERDSGIYTELFKCINPKLTIISDGPSKETSATDIYWNISSGWTVYSRSNKTKKERFCLTTRKDGVIRIVIGYNGRSNDRPFIHVTSE